MDELNSRERVRLAVEHQETDRVPVDYYAVPEVSERLIQELKVDDPDQLHDLLGIDFRQVAGRYVGPADKAGGFNVLDTAQDIWGVVRKPATNAFSTYAEIVHHPLGGMTTVAEIDGYDWPSVEWFDFSHIRDQIRQWDRREPRWTWCFGGGAFESPWYMRGLDQFLIDLIEQPDLAEAISRNVVKFYIACMRKLYEACDGRLDMVLTGGDIGTQRGMMLAPELWRKHVRPYTELLIRTYAGWGLKTIYHSCGAIRPVIDDFIRMGLDVLDPIQPLAEGMAPISIKEEFGDQLTLHGGIDEQQLLPTGTADEVFEHTRRMKDVLSRNGGYILCAAHAIQADTPSENILAIYRAAGSTDV